VAQTFADIPQGGLALICGSAGTVEVAADRGSAAQVLGAKVGMEVVLKDAPQPG
jgi:S-adenosylmethionine hydrolase